MAAVIEARGLTKCYGETVAVNDVSFEVPAGALYGLLGPNGSGKSTTIRMLSGQTRPTSGTATVLGIDAAADPVGVRRRIGIIPEQETPPSFLTAWEVPPVRRLGPVARGDGRGRGVVVRVPRLRRQARRPLQGPLPRDAAEV